jgi:hypothetical protein
VKELSPGEWVLYDTSHWLLQAIDGDQAIIVNHDGHDKRVLLSQLERLYDGNTRTTTKTS